MVSGGGQLRISTCDVISDAGDGMVCGAHLGWKVEKSSLCIVTSCVAYAPLFRTFLLATVFVGPKMTVGEGLGPPIFADRCRLEPDVLSEWLSNLGISFSWLWVTMLVLPS